jgi:hypothetical protein
VKLLDLDNCGQGTPRHCHTVDEPGLIDAHVIHAIAAVHRSFHPLLRQF